VALKDNRKAFMFENEMARHQWLTPVILLLRKQIRRIVVQTQPGQIVCETLSQKYLTQKRAGRVAQAECLHSKFETLSSKLRTAKEKSLYYYFLNHFYIIYSYVYTLFGPPPPPYPKQSFMYIYKVEKERCKKTQIYLMLQLYTLKWLTFMLYILYQDKKKKKRRECICYLFVTET
jgi:hypothetical protein